MVRETEGSTLGFVVPWLRIFLAAPTKEMPGTIMPVGVPDAQEIDDLIAYLETLR